MKTTNQMAEHIGTRLRVLPATTSPMSTLGGSTSGWRRPACAGGVPVVGNGVIDNSTDVSARERRHR